MTVSLLSTVYMEVSTKPQAVEAIKARLMPAQPDLEIEAEGYHTWNIENYRALAKRAHGPTFEVGGQPWYETFQLSERLLC
jgi:hypothetical protein